MYQIGEYVVYGTRGVCLVQDIRHVDMPGAPAERMYYILQPMQDKGATVYLPTDNDKAVIRHIMDGDEARELVDDIPDIGGLDIPDDKKREVTYKEAMKSCDSRTWVRMIRTLSLRRESRLALGKKVTTLDERFFKAAMGALGDELSIALEISPEEAEDMIQEAIRKE